MWLAVACDQKTLRKAPQIGDLWRLFEKRSKHHKNCDFNECTDHMRWVTMAHRTNGVAFVAAKRLRVREVRKQDK